MNITESEEKGKTLKKGEQSLTASFKNKNSLQRQRTLYINRGSIEQEDIIIMKLCTQ